MSSVQSGSSLNKEATLLEKVCFVILLASNSHFILYICSLYSESLPCSQNAQASQNIDGSIDSSAPLFTQTSTTEKNKSAETI